MAALDRVKGLVDRIAALEDEKAAIDGDIEVILAEADQAGLDRDMLLEVVRVKLMADDARAREHADRGAFLTARAKYLKAAGVSE